MHNALANDTCPPWHTMEPALPTAYAVAFEQRRPCVALSRRICTRR